MGVGDNINFYTNAPGEILGVQSDIKGGGCSNIPWLYGLLPYFPFLDIQRWLPPSTHPIWTCTKTLATLATCLLLFLVGGTLMKERKKEKKENEIEKKEKREKCPLVFTFGYCNAFDDF